MESFIDTPHVCVMAWCIQLKAYTMRRFFIIYLNVITFPVHFFPSPHFKHHYDKPYRHAFNETRTKYWYPIILIKFQMIISFTSENTTTNFLSQKGKIQQRERREKKKVKKYQTKWNEHYTTIHIAEKWFLFDL